MSLQRCSLVRLLSSPVYCQLKAQVINPQLRQTHILQALKGLSCLIVVSSFCNKIGPHAFWARCVWLIKLIKPKRIMWLVGVIVQKAGTCIMLLRQNIIERVQLIFCSSFVWVVILAQVVGSFRQRVCYFFSYLQLTFWLQEYVLHLSCQQLIPILVGLSALLMASALKGRRWD